MMKSNEFVRDGRFKDWGKTLYKITEEVDTKKETKKMYKCEQTPNFCSLKRFLVDRLILRRFENDKMTR